MENPANKLVNGIGGRSAAAAEFNVSTEAIRLWLKNGIPADRALDVEERTRGTEFSISAVEVLEYQRHSREEARAA